MLLMIDNYDSFTYNLVQYFGELGADVRVVRNDEAEVDALLAMKPDHVCISPGPCAPAQAGVSLAAIRAFTGKVPVLGVCLGHQAIGEAFGGRIVRAGRIMHGKTDTIEDDGRGVFTGLPQKLTVARYHSLVIERSTLPECLEITAVSSDGEIQGVRHKTMAVEGVQFHPESIASECGHEMLKNFLAM
ncbi:MAG: aminodeoxychorismate/anthranilate synthase component II [Duodenibacillus sp.]|nr:aminodeoxychorismate/anthranilate synthase component II [Duodenibacillus sp.]